jgi:hypothetical protein
MPKLYAIFLVSSRVQLWCDERSDIAFINVLYFCDFCVLECFWLVQNSAHVFKLSNVTSVLLHSNHSHKHRVTKEKANCYQLIGAYDCTIKICMELRFSLCKTYITVSPLAHAFTNAVLRDFPSVVDLFLILVITWRKNCPSCSLVLKVAMGKCFSRQLMLHSRYKSTALRQQLSSKTNT